MPKWNTAEVISIEKITETTQLIKLKALSEGEMNFVPGQFITFDLPVGEKRLDRWRSYSIANLPDREGIIELCIVKVPEGRATTYLFEEIELGTELKYKGPLGNFVLPDPLDVPVVLICTGTGVAPFRSMIIDQLEHKSTEQNIHLVFGTRLQKDILYKEELEALAHRHPNFTYDIALSRERYMGYQGYVHGLYARTPNDELQKRKIYLCGWQNMIDEAVENLTQNLNVDRSNILYELYG